ncbi:MAG: DUF2975 domain-containing protein [Clostridium sp.]|nr:DUF2975 domain-containing protein [Clostridium sp.]MCM1170542.1 DUF2975 domain-containing protein [Clostridium sp.]MCM1207931.1 DUF2975 domain-containing protein [Ruminococcus sp.]
MKDSKITRVTKLLLDIMFFGGIIVTLTLPVSFKFYGKYNDFFETYYTQLLIIFFISGVFAVLILRELRCIFDTVLRDDCFVEENVKSLNRMGLYSFAIMLVSLLRCPLYFTPAVFIIVIVFLVAGLFSRVLAIVFARAVEYKQENDFTI